MKTILFLDVDGVLSIPNVRNTDERKEHWPGCGVLWPIPMANALLQAIDADDRLLPVWLSAWDCGCWEWNLRAGTKCWAVAYHLSKVRQTWALRRYPECQGRHIDGKLLAVRWFLRHSPHTPVVWIEDGFAQETEVWAAREPRVRLVNTWPMESETACFLREQHPDLDQAAHEFLNRYCLNVETYVSVK